MKSKKNKIIICIVFSVFFVFATSITARYFINKKQAITISSRTSNVDITINSTTGNIETTSSTQQFTVSIKNNNDYVINYTVTPTSEKFVVEGNVSNISLDAGASIDVPITVKIKSGVYYTDDSDSVTVNVDVIKPYKLATKTFNLDITTFNYNLRELIFAFNTQKSTTPNFGENVTTEASSGIFTMDDETDTSYYFRGINQNNFVSFAGRLWRIMRINGDGSYRLISHNVIGKSTYSTLNSTTQDNIGYMYSAISSGVTTTSNTSNSAIKTYLDNWYDSNLSSFSDYFDQDAIFWNDRRITSQSTGYVYYAGWSRIVGTNSKPTPTLDPYSQTDSVNKNDLFSVTTKKGNGKLTRPIGLPTADEIVLAGATMTGAKVGEFGSFFENLLYYIHSAGDTTLYGIWTMTPRRYSYSNPVNSHIIVSKPQAGIYSEPGYHSTTTRFVKPVINLKSTVMTKGSGTESDPFRIKSYQ